MRPALRRDWPAHHRTHLVEKKVAALPRTERVSLLDQPPQEVALVRQAALLGLNRAHLYYQPRPIPPATLALQRRIDEIYTAHPYYGARRITAQLHHEGQPVNHKAVARHMRLLELTAIYPGPNLSKRAHAATLHPYLLRGVPARYPDH